MFGSVLLPTAPSFYQKKAFGFMTEGLVDTKNVAYLATGPLIKYN